MAKLKQDSITVADIKEYLDSADDFQLELHVFRSCEFAGMVAKHGGTYKDPVTGVNRQFDVRAFYGRKNTNLRLAIECKATRTNCPLLVSRVPRDYEESRHYSIITSGTLSIPQAAIEPLRTYFPQGEQVGKSTAQIGRSEARPHGFVANDGELFNKWTQAIASANDLVKEALSDFKLESNTLYAATTVQPILVVSDDTLWVADHGPDGVRLQEPYQVNECSLYLDAAIPYGLKSSQKYPITHLLIFTKSGFDAFLEKFANIESFRDRLCLDHLDVRDMVRKHFGTAGL